MNQQELDELRDRVINPVTILMFIKYRPLSDHQIIEQLEKITDYINNLKAEK